MNQENMQKARIEKQLLKVACFDCGIMTYKDFFINHVSRVDFKLSNNMDKYNRIKFNRMDSNKKQDEYIARLEKPINEYRAYIKGETSFISINKLLFEGFKLLNFGNTINMRD